MAGHVVTLRLDEARFRRLQALSEKTHRPKSYYLRELLDRHLEDMEDAYLALERLNNPRSRRVPQEQVEREFGLR